MGTMLELTTCDLLPILPVFAMKEQEVLVTYVQDKIILIIARAILSWFHLYFTMYLKSPFQVVVQHLV